MANRGLRIERGIYADILEHMCDRNGKIEHDIDTMAEWFGYTVPTMRKWINTLLDKKLLTLYNKELYVVKLKNRKWYSRWLGK